MKKFIALCVSSIFAFSLGIAYAEEEHIQNPWERIAQPSAKKENRAKTKALKSGKKEAGKANAQKTKRTNIAKAEKTRIEKADKKSDTEATGNAGTAKEEKKETEQKKKFIFW